MGNVSDFSSVFIERRLEAALEADADGEYETALGEVQRALHVNPHEPRAEALAAVYSALLDDERDALRHAHSALSRAPVSAEVAYWAAVARHVVGAQAGALEALEIVLALEPGDPDARMLSERCHEAMTNSC
ncbi:MAG: hypothetical protein KTR21_07375 [Rhodobacteraceae bacterium]|nr:hypothetical protein [Paracoccaceae bacterium]